MKKSQWIVKIITSLSISLAFGLNVSQGLEFVMFLHAFLFQQAKTVKISTTEFGLDSALVILKAFFYFTLPSWSKKLL